MTCRFKVGDLVRVHPETSDTFVSNNSLNRQEIYTIIHIGYFKDDTVGYLIRIKGLSNKFEVHAFECRFELINVDVGDMEDDL